MIYEKPANEIQKTENEIYQLTAKLLKLRRDAKPVEVKNYTFHNLAGEITLRKLFGDKTTLFAIHNMGQGCRYCTIWADGLNAFLPHLESRAAVVLLSKDAPELQRCFANDRGWRFQTASHGGGAYLAEQGEAIGGGNMPGLLCYELQGDKILRKNASTFGPGDQFCALWNVLSLAGIDEENFAAQFHYWKAPAKLDDGGKNAN